MANLLRKKLSKKNGRPRGSLTRHNKIVNDCVKMLNAVDIPAWRLEAKAVMVSPGVFRAPIEPGLPDIIAVSRMGKFVGIEVKTGKSQLSEAQKEVRNKIERSNGLFFIIHSKQDIEVLICELITT